MWPTALTPEPERGRLRARVVLAQEGLGEGTAQKAEGVLVAIPGKVHHRWARGDTGGLQQPLQLRRVSLRVGGRPAEADEQARRGTKEDASQGARGNSAQA